MHLNLFCIINKVKKLSFLYSVFVVILVACDFSMPKLVSHDPVDSLKIQRYDRVESRYLTTGDFAALQEMNTVYPTQTRALIEDLLKLGSVSDPDINKRLLDFYQDSTLQNVIYAAESEFADMTDINEGIRKSFEKLVKEVPGLQIPTFYAQIGSFDQSIVVDDKAIGISLDKYLGKNYPTYLRFYDEEARESMSREYIVHDCIIFYLLSQYPVSRFEGLSQQARDMNLGKFFYAANYLTGRKLLETPSSKTIEQFMKKHPSFTLAQLLALQDIMMLL